MGSPDGGVDRDWEFPGLHCPGQEDEGFRWNWNGCSTFYGNLVPTVISTAKFNAKAKVNWWFSVNSFVNVAMTAFTEKTLDGEAVGSRFKISMEEVGNLKGFVHSSDIYLL